MSTVVSSVEGGLLEVARWISAAGDGCGQVSQVVDDDVRDVRFSLQDSSGDEGGGCSRDRTEAAPDVGVHDQVDRSRFVFERHEGDSPSCPWVLTDEHNARDSDAAVWFAAWQ